MKNSKSGTGPARECLLEPRMLSLVKYPATISLSIPYGGRPWM
jgi:hypothetical protein